MTEIGADAEKAWGNFLAGINAAMDAIDLIAKLQDEGVSLRARYGVDTPGGYCMSIGAANLRDALKVQLASYVESGRLTERL